MTCSTLPKIEAALPVAFRNFLCGSNFSCGARPVTALESLAEVTARTAYGHHINQAKLEVQQALYEAYIRGLHVPLDRVALEQLNSATGLSVVAKLEGPWSLYEHMRAQGVLEFSPTEGNIKQQITSILLRHPTTTHPIFDFLEKAATRKQYVVFFAYDYALNTRFFDFVVLSAIGLEGDGKQEVARNFWDESGRGEAEKAHTHMFHQLMLRVCPEFSEAKMIEGMGFEALTGFNLFYWLGLRRAHYYKYLGCLAATELLDPPQYAKLLRGARRLRLENEIDLAYYEEHATLDIEHGEGWLTNVMHPLSEEDPSSFDDMLIGAAMRLNTCRDYYDWLFERVTA
jgi:hypothetical protein